jgi:hypothetical protein
MKYRSKPQLVNAMQWSGLGKDFVPCTEWVSSLDIENCEVSNQGGTEPYALDLITATDIRTLEAGDWLICREGQLYAESASSFERNYEVWRE